MNMREKRNRAKSPEAEGRSAPRAPRHLLACWPELRKSLRAAKRVVLFLDFDGTLVRLRRRPEDVRLASTRRRLLRRLARRPGNSLYFISGRGLEDLRRLVHVPGAHYLGLHGWEQSLDGAPEPLGKKRMEKARKFIEKRIRDLPGMWVQDKRACLAVHYRSASPADAEKARAVVMEALERLGPEFRLLAGKKVWELMHRRIGTKGDAARDILSKLPGRLAVFYFGDDTTDETAFAALKTAVTVRVGKFHKTRARFFLKGPGEVSEFLAGLDQFLKGRPRDARTGQRA
jgi:trehalose-phosphatase